MAAKRYATKFNLLQSLSDIDRKIKYPEKILGISSTSEPTMVSPQRISMYDKHVSQHMTLNKHDFPRIFTGTENLYGDLSHYYNKAKHDYKVVKIIKKFKTNHVGVVFVKDMTTNEYDVIDRMDAKAFSEVFGFAFNNDALDDLNESDIIPKDKILSHSTGYDEFNNYCMGVNALTLFSFHPNLTEDAAMISSSFANRVTFNKLHQITIKIPDQNMIPLNTHGDDDHYKIIPDVGDTVTDILAALRHISITQMADLTNDQLTKVNRLQDTVYFAKGEVIDIDLYDNKPFPEGMVYDQLRYYQEQQRIYYKRIYEFCQSIKKEKRTRKLKTLYAKAMDFVNEEGVWIDKNIIKSINVNITLRERVKLIPGQKITGRYGNKSVVSIVRHDPDEIDDAFDMTVIPDDRMPKMKDGRTIDLMVNAISCFNRNIAFALYEPCLNAMFDRFLAYIKDWKTDDQFDFIMNIIQILNPQFAEQELQAMKDTKTTKKEFMENAYAEGIYLRVDPFVTTLTLRDSIVRLYREYSDILKPEKLMVWYPARQQYVESILPSIAGDTYVMVLKQDGVKGASARNAGTVSPEGLPIKSNNKSNYMSEMSDTAIKLGEYDRLTFNIGITNEELINYIMLTRASVEGRGWLERAIHNPDEPIPKRFENRAVRINNCYLNVLGTSLELVPRQNQLKIPSPESMQTYIFRNTAITMSEYDMYWMHRICLRFDRIRKKELKKGREYDTMDLWNYAFKDTDYPNDWIDDKKKEIMIKYVDDILLTNK